MEVTVNENKATDAGSRKLFTGVTNAFVTDLNPTQERLQELGFKAEKAPNYFMKDDKEDPEKVTGIRLNFHLEFSEKEETFKTTLTFYLRKEVIKSLKDPQNITTNRIDRFGKNKFLSDADLLDTELQAKFDWIDWKSLKPVMKGQIELVDFLRSYAGCKQNEPLQFETEDLRKLYAGDMTPIVKHILKPAIAKENSVRVLLGVKENNGRNYQVVFDRKFDFPWSYTTKYIQKVYNDNRNYIPAGITYGPIGFDANENDMLLREYVPQAQTPNPAAPQPSSMMPQNTVINDYFGSGGSEAAVANSPGNNQANDDDLPF